MHVETVPAWSPMEEDIRVVELHKSELLARELLVSPSGEGAVSSRRRRRFGLRKEAFRLFYATFLPVGYPGTVREGYLEYQLWDLCQGLCTYLRMTLAVKALLEGLGVGDATATAVGGSLLWVARDGTKMVSSLIFSYLSATEMGLHVRQWRLFADVANDIGLTLNVSAPMFGEWFLPVTCLGSAFMAVMGVCAQATKTSISEHFALASLSDCVTKEGTQETGVHLFGLVGGAMLVHWLGDTDAPSSIARLWVVFGTLTVLHMYANARAVATLRFDRVNETRFGILKETFRTGGDLRPVAIAKKEPRLPAMLWKRRRVHLGVKMEDAVLACGCQDTIASGLAAARAAGARYIILPPAKGSVYVLLHPSASANDILKARFFGEALLTGDDSFANEEDGVDGAWAKFHDALVSSGWNTDVSLLSVDLWRYDWMEDILKKGF